MNTAGCYDGNVLVTVSAVRPVFTEFPGGAMNTFIWAGMSLGTALGFLHMLHFLSVRLRKPHLSKAKTIWQALWIWGLWALFGAYVLALWIAGAVLLGVSKFFMARRASHDRG